jgi:hypothetical protein
MRSDTIQSLMCDLENENFKPLTDTALGDVWVQTARLQPIRSLAGP